MARHQPFEIIGYHSCDRDIGLKVLNGDLQLQPSTNSWDWLGHGIYFWEQDPMRAFHYATDVAEARQYNKRKIKTPFVLGAIIELGNCLNLVESESLAILDAAYKGMNKLATESGIELPKNNGPKRQLDCAVLKYVHESRKVSGEPAYDTVRSPFDEGIKVYPDANFSSRHHIQVCVISPRMIKGYFLPLPIEEFNPYLKKEYIPRKN